MKYTVKQIGFDEISKSIEYFITSSGYETRTTEQASKIIDFCKNAFVLGLAEFRDEPTRLQNDSFFKSKKVVYSTVEDLNDIERVLKFIEKDIFSKSSNSGTKLNIYVDYSCMPKDWYAKILTWFNYCKINSQARIFFGYSHSSYFEHSESELFNEVIRPIEGFSNLTLPVYMNSLILTLGNDRSQILGIKEYFDCNPYLVYSNESYNEKYCKEIEHKHEELINTTENSKIFKLPIHDLSQSFNILFNLSSALVQESRIIFAPCGPKPFTLLNLIITLNLQFNSVVWRISQGKHMTPVDRKATGLITVIELVAKE